MTEDDLHEVVQAHLRARCTGGKVSLFNASRSTHVVANVVGWYSSS